MRGRQISEEDLQGAFLPFGILLIFLPIDHTQSRSMLKCILPGDLRVLHAARQTARQNFDSNLSLSSSSAEAVAGIAHAEDVAQVLRRHVVQGERVGEEAVDQGGRYRRFFPLAKKSR
ncbi:Mitochondrial zinc maintenance protein 1, mitochondrial [Peltigera leucophlebia]|nr:Mitochondrial zinc maintenance protein 1, mitochondrial [Peltigera leucophlebia]